MNPTWRQETAQAEKVQSSPPVQLASVGNSPVHKGGNVKEYAQSWGHCTFLECMVEVSRKVLSPHPGGSHDESLPSEVKSGVKYVPQWFGTGGGQQCHHLTVL